MQKRIKTIDISLYLIPIVLLAIGVAVIYSLVFGTNLSGYGIKQGVFALIGVGIMVTFSFVDYRHFRGMSWLLYAIAILLLIFVDFFGKTVNGAENWIDLKIFQLQPSEVAKIFFIISLSSFFSQKIGHLRWRDIFVSLIIFAVPVFLIIREPDLGTAMVVCFIYFVMLMFARPSKSQLAVIFGVILSLAVVAGMAFASIKPFDNVLKEYQKKRIEVFLNPDLDPTGRGYNVKQAEITIGSGGLTGRGLGKGTQSQLQFLPEAHTDFIFAGIAESFGFSGSVLILFLYGFLIVRLLEIGNSARDNFGLLLVMGVLGMFSFQVIVSIGMNLGLLPVTGIPLPLLSYGGTSLFISMFALGVVQSVFIRHEKIAFK